MIGRARNNDGRDSISHVLTKNVVGVAIVTLAAFCCTSPLFINKGLPYAQDIVFHVFQADQFSQAIKDGLFFPRWARDVNNGYGGPNFIFYAPLSYYFFSLVHLFTSSITVSMIVTVFFSFFLSGLTMLIAARKLYGGTASAVTAFLYQIMPFHLRNLYVRGTLSELLAYAWFPLVILFLQEAAETRTRTSVAGLSISYAGLILTHLVSAFMFSIVIAGFLLYRVLLKDGKGFLMTLLSLILGLGLSSAYLVPVIFERKFVQIEYIVTCAVGNYKKNFLFMWDKIQTGLRAFYLPLHAGVILEAAIFLLIVMIIRRNGEISRNKHFLTFYVVLFMAAFFLTTPLSRPVWDIAPGFPTLQFPWRWVSIMEVSLCFLIGYFFPVGKSSSTGQTILKRAVAYLLIALSFMSFGTIFKSRIISGSAIDSLTTPQQIRRLFDPVMEYVPIWVENIDSVLSEDRNEQALVILGKASVKVEEWKSEERIMNISAETPSLLRISTFYYPGWQASVDGKPAAIEVAKHTGAMLIKVPAGKHAVELRFVATPLRHFANIISTISFVVIVLLLFTGLIPRVHRMRLMAH